MYEGWAHTDAILEGPLSGDNTLCADLVMQIKTVFPFSLQPPCVPATTSLSPSSTTFITLPSSTSIPMKKASYFETASEFFSTSFSVRTSTSISTSFPSYSVLSPNLLFPANNLVTVKTTDMIKAVDEKDKNGIDVSGNLISLGLNNEMCVSTVCPICSLRFGLKEKQSFVCIDKREYQTNEYNNDQKEKMKKHVNNSNDNNLNKRRKEDINIVKIKAFLSAEHSSTQPPIAYVVAAPIDIHSYIKKIPGECSVEICHCKELLLSGKPIEIKNKNKLTSTNLSVANTENKNKNLTVNGNVIEIEDKDKNVNLTDSEKAKDSSVENRSNKESETTERETFKDCQVPRVLIYLARFVNPF